MAFECSEASAGYGRKFGGLEGFDFHLSREHPNGTVHSFRCHCSDWWPRCKTDEELRAGGYAPNDRGVWRGPQDPRFIPAMRTENHAGTQSGSRG